MDIKPDKQRYKFKKLSKERLDLILEDIRQGSPKKYAAESNGISEKFLHYVIAQGICDVDHDINDTLYAYFVLSLRKIEKEEIISCRKDIRANEKGHKGAEWTLEHAYWRQFCGDAKIMALAKEIEMDRQNSQESEDEKSK